MWAGGQGYGGEGSQKEFILQGEIPRGKRRVTRGKSKGKGSWFKSKEIVGHNTSTYLGSEREGAEGGEKEAQEVRAHRMRKDVSKGRILEEWGLWERENKKKKKKGGGHRGDDEGKSPSKSQTPQTGVAHTFTISTPFLGRGRKKERGPVFFCSSETQRGRRAQENKDVNNGQVDEISKKETGKTRKGINK